MPEERQRKSMRTSELDKMINKLQSLERVDGTSEYYKNNAIAYLSDLANHLDRIGVKTIKMRPEVAAAILDGDVYLKGYKTGESSG